MELKYRKLIKNTMPKYNDGEIPSVEMNLKPIQALDAKQMRHPAIQFDNPTMKLSNTDPNIIAGGKDFGTPNNNGTNTTTRVLNISQAVPTFIGDISNFYNQAYNQPKVDELISTSGTTNRNTMGVGYQWKNSVDSDILSRSTKQGYANTFKAATNAFATGASFNPWAGIIAGGVTALLGIGSTLTGRETLRARKNKANLSIARQNIGNWASATGTGLYNDYYTNKYAPIGRVNV